MDKIFILNKLRENRDFFEKHKVKKIGLFGSYLDGEVTEESDIDILVHFEYTPDVYFNYCKVLYFLEDLFEKKIDLVQLSEEEPIYNVKEVKDHFLKVRKEILDSVVYA